MRWGAAFALAMGSVVASHATEELRVLPTGGLHVETAALLVSGQEGGPVPLAAWAAPLAPLSNVTSASGKVSVLVILEVQGVALVDGMPPLLFSPPLAPLAIDIALYALDAEGSLAASLLETVQIPSGPALESFRTAGLRYTAALPLPPGRYTLRALVGDAKTQTVGLRALALTVPPATDAALGEPTPQTAPPLFPREPNAPWLDAASRTAAAFPPNPVLLAAPVRSVDVVAATSPTPAPSDDAQVGKARWRRAEQAALEKAYLAALAPLAQGDLPAARTAVAAFEVPLLTGEHAVAIGDLAKLEARALQKLIRPLTRDEPEGLLLLVSLYVGLHAHYQDRALRQPTMHAAILASGFVDLYARQPSRNGTGGRTLAAGLLVGLVPRLIQGGLVNFAEQLLVQARALDPAHPLALLTAARLAERQAHTEAATQALETLVKLEPQNAEAQLRLAIQRARAGDAAKARALLRTLVASAPSDLATAEAWVYAVASQELARIDLGLRDWSAATETLALARARFPNDEKLTILQAMLADLEGDGDTARGTLDNVSFAKAGEPSPRLVYAQVSLTQIAELSKTLEPLVAARAPAFAVAWRQVLGKGKR